MSILDNIPLVLANKSNYGTNRPSTAIKYLIYHYTGNDGDKSMNNAKYFRDNAVEASAHYFVDDTTVIQSVPDLYVAYAVGGKKWSDTATTGGGKMYGIITNRNSISIEMCDTSRDGSIQASEKTLQLALELGRALMEKYNIPIQNVYRHFDVTGKHCPAYFMDQNKWSNFKNQLEESDVTEQRVLELINAAQPKVYTSVQGCPEWARSMVQRAVDKGVLTGNDKGQLYLTDQNLVNLQVLSNLKLF